MYRALTKDELISILNSAYAFEILGGILYFSIESIIMKVGNLYYIMNIDNLSQAIWHNVWHVVGLDILDKISEDRTRNSIVRDTVMYSVIDCILTLKDPLRDHIETYAYTKRD